MDQISPIKIERTSDLLLTITWNTGQKQQIDTEILRTKCPCATCKEARGEGSHSKPLGPSKKSLLRVIDSTKDEQISIRRIWAVGNYAIGIEWGDGHDTGIYPYKYLFDLEG